MLLRLSLIVAIIAGLAAGTVAYLEVSQNIPALIQQREQEKTDKVAAQTELSSTKKTLKKTQTDLAQTQQDLSDTKNDLAKASARADAQNKRADDLADKLAKATQERDDAQNELASYKATGLTPEQIIAFNKQIKDANAKIAAISDERDLLNRQLTKTKAELASIIGTSPDIELPADLHGKITVVDPKWDFVVLNIGDKDGVIPDGELLVSRNGKLVAKVVVRTVEDGRCIANVVPGWKLGEMFEGDDVTPAHPAS